MELTARESSFLAELGLKLKASGTLKVLMDCEDLDMVCETLDSIAEGVR